MKLEIEKAKRFTLRIAIDGETMDYGDNWVAVRNVADTMIAIAQTLGTGRRIYLDDEPIAIKKDDKIIGALTVTAVD